MEQFNKLPLQQKIVVMLVVMGAVAGLFWYALIMPFDEQKAQAATQRNTVQQEIDKLKAENAKDKTADRKVEKDKLEGERKAFEEMLPKKEELEKFITGINETARNAGLTILSFEKGLLNEQDYYQEVPISMEVTGTFREFIGFLRTISEKDRRVVNIRDLKLSTEDLPIQDLLTKYETQRKEEIPEGMPVKELSDAQKLMQLVRANEEAIQAGQPLKAKFVAYVFTYTGKPASDAAAQKNAQKLEAKKNRRKGKT